MSETEKPKIHLSLGANSKQQSSDSSQKPPEKKRKYNSVELPSRDANAANLSTHHQKTTLHFILQKNHESSKWIANGETTIYVSIPEDTAGSADATATNATAPANLSTMQAIALHCRGSVQIDTVTVHTLSDNKIQPARTSFHHADPLKQVLLKPPESYTQDDIGKYKRHADSQCTRGATGMAKSLRAASIASNMGELRITYEATPEKSDNPQEIWKQDLLSNNGGEAIQRCQTVVNNRGGSRRQKRIDLVSKRLAERKAAKVVVRYSIHLSYDTNHLGGLHAFTTKDTPHIYTTAGILGDHEGARCWLPTLDSASARHRATHELTIMVTAPFIDGLSSFGFGEDYGFRTTLLHENSWDEVKAVSELGAKHVELLKSSIASSNMHLVPPEKGVTLLTNVRATNVYCTACWVPAPARSLGFAIGPFRVIEDAEYFDETTFMEDSEVSIATYARENGEGIRQVYFAPLFARKFVHADADRRLLPIATIQLNPLDDSQTRELEKLDSTLSFSTVGVVHRALSLMRDILALPRYRTSSYTQIWIPDAVHGGSAIGALPHCPEFTVNPFLGGAILDSRILPPPGSRLPFYHGGRTIQFLQARNAFRGWLTSSVPLGGNDDVGNGYIFALFESLLMGLYERGHGAHGEGGSKGSVFYTKRYALTSGLNSPNLDFLPISNVEETDPTVAGIAALPVDDRNTDYLWRSITNGSESHTSALDEFNARKQIVKDIIEIIERGTDKDDGVPNPSWAWFGSHLALTFLSSNSSSSSGLGCGAVELVHQLGGMPYRVLKANLLREIVEGRAGLNNFIRLVRAAFIASHLSDIGEKNLKIPVRKGRKDDKAGSQTPKEKAGETSRPAFHTCVDEILRKGGITHTLFTRALQNLSGRSHEANLLGTLVDIERKIEDPRTKNPLVEPEGFPNSFVRGASPLYCRVGVYVEQAREGTASQAQSAAMLVKGIQLQMYAEPVIPEGGIAYGGPVTVRVVENEGYLREHVKDLAADGSRRDWGATFLHAKPVTSAKDQLAASGSVEDAKAKDTDLTSPVSLSFNESGFHSGGYQAIELLRLTNLTPLLWVRVDPSGIFGGNFSVFQPDACLAEQLFHDGDASAQIEACRYLAERPLQIQGSVKVKKVHDVSISELPVRVLGDCLRGSPALHSSLPHTPVVRAQAALAIAQWQNNKAPNSKDAKGVENWIGLHLLLQYFRERFNNHSLILPPKYTRLVLKKSETEATAAAATTAAENSGGTGKNEREEAYVYLDSLEEGEERANALDDAEELDVEEDEEYRVRAAVVTAISSIRAKDGLSPPVVIEFLEKILESEDAELNAHLIYPEDDIMTEKQASKQEVDNPDDDDENEETERDASSEINAVNALSYVSSTLIAEALLCCCNLNARPLQMADPSGSRHVSDRHPLDKLIGICQGWLEWELYREKIRQEFESRTRSGVGNRCHGYVAAAALTALSHLVIAKQSTTTDAKVNESKEEEDIVFSYRDNQNVVPQNNQLAYYKKIFLAKAATNELTRAAAAQALLCICCAADRFETKDRPPFGLLAAMELITEAIEDEDSSPNFRQTLAVLMMDACTGKICSMQRVACVGGGNQLEASLQRFLSGPLGPSHGLDNGSAILTSVTAGSFPSASAVNDGARRGLRLIGHAGHSKEEGVDENIVVRVAILSSTLWRLSNGDQTAEPTSRKATLLPGPSAFDGYLRITLLNLYSWLWPRGCFAVMQVQAWKAHEDTDRYRALGAHRVMKISDEEKEAAETEDKSLESLSNMVDTEIDRQSLRGELYKMSYEISTTGKSSLSKDAGAAEQGIGQPLPPIKRNAAFKQGGWVSSAAQQRREMALDGGRRPTSFKLRGPVKSGDT